MYELSDEVYDDLVAKGEAGNLSDEQISYLVAELERATDENYLEIGVFRALHTFGLGIRNKPELIEKYRLLIEKFLLFKEATKEASMAYIVLTDFWNLNEEYLETTRLFLRKVDWDKGEYLRIATTKQAGKFLRNNFDRELFELLLLPFEENDIDWGAEDRFIWNASYCALARASGMKEDEIPDLGNENVRALLKEGKVSFDPIDYAKAKLRENDFMSMEI